MFKQKHKFFDLKTLFLASGLAILLFGISPRVLAYTADPNQPSCFASGTHQLTSCDDRYKGTILKNGKCYIEVRGGPNGDLIDYAESGCATADIASGSTASTTNSNIIVTKYINPAINFLSVGFGLIVTAVLVIAGIQYATAGGDPQAISKAKKKIVNALLALVAFIFMYAFLQWLVPGGLF